MFRTASIALGLAAALTLSGCGGEEPDGRSTADAGGAAAGRPVPDGLSYPTDQVAIARRGDTVSNVARRVGIDPPRLANFNGLTPDTFLRSGDILALPPRPSENNNRVRADVAALAGAAIERSTDTAPAPSAAGAGPLDPVRHRVSRGETVYSISRLYGVSVRSLADWNGLGPDLKVRTGQNLIIPIAPKPPAVKDTAPPGQGASIVPAPPSAVKPLPRDTTIKAAPLPPSPNLGAEAPNPDTEAPDTTGMEWPVTGEVIRDFSKGRTDGIDIAAPSGTTVKAADAGTVAAITQDTHQVPIMVLRHEDNLLSVYANIADISVKKGDRVTKGQNIAKVREGDPSFLYFEVRQGFESVDPNDFLN